MKTSKLLFLIVVTVLLWSCDKKDPEGGEIVSSINSKVNAIAVDADNTKWIGTEDGLYRSVDGGFQLMNHINGGEVFSLSYLEDEDLLWIGSESGLASAVVAESGIEDSPVSTNNLSDPKVVAIHVDSDSKKWFGTAKGFTLNYNDKWKSSIFRANNDGDTFPLLAEDFTINSISSQDSFYYFATSGTKLWRAFGFDETVDAFTGATQWDFPYNGMAITDTMFVVFIDNAGNKWMGGKEGIQVHKGDDPKDYEAFTYYYDELPDFYVLTINQASNGDIWVGTRKGIARFDGTSWEIINEGLPGLNVNSIAFDNDGSVWVGTNSGLAHLE